MKKILGIISCILIVFALSACGSLNLGQGVEIGPGGIVQTTGGSDNQTSSRSDYITMDSSGQIPTSNTPAPSNNPNSSAKPNNSQSSGGGNIKPTPSTGNGGNTSQNPPTSTPSGGQPSGNITSSEKPVSYGGLSESAFVTWKDSNPSGAKAFYKMAGASSYTQVDQQLITKDKSGNARVDMLGLKAGSYDLRIDTSDSKKIEVAGVVVTAYDRSGYAHDGFSGVGAYNDDGTLKSGVKVVYITEATKNNLVKSMNSNTVIRIIGKITCKAYVSANKFDNYTDISGISRKTMSDDSYFNMVDVNGRSNVTLEGVGDSAECFQFGFTWKKCNSIEVRNLTFTSYPEDACSFEGSSGSESSYGNYWVHNNTFNRGKNGWDLTAEKDKYAGDGATDIKYCHNVTMSYNYYNNCKKTMLVGGSDKNIQYNITLHHNHYYKNESRLPLGRTGNVHIYNCYYDDNKTCMSTRNGCFIFSEKNYYYSCDNITDGKTKFKIKSFGDVFDGTSKGSYFTVVSSRDQTVESSCNYDTTFAYKKAPSYVTDANRAKTDCTSFAGPNKANQF